MPRKLTRITLLMMLFVGWSTLASSAGMGSIGTVTKLEVVRGQGVVVFGSFGNPNSCSHDAGFWIKIDHPQYAELYSMALTAMTAGMRLQPYLRACEAIGWHGGMWNVVTGADAMYLHPSA